MIRFIHCDNCDKDIGIRDNRQIIVFHSPKKIQKINGNNGITILRLPEGICPKCGSESIKPISNHKFAQKK